MVNNCLRKLQSNSNPFALPTSEHTFAIFEYLQHKERDVNNALKLKTCGKMMRKCVNGRGKSFGSDDGGGIEEDPDSFSNADVVEVEVEEEEED